MIMLEMQLTQDLSKDSVNEPSVGLHACPTPSENKRVFTVYKVGLQVHPHNLEWQSQISFWSLVCKESHFLSKCGFWEAP